jgi:hypothetical protein
VKVKCISNIGKGLEVYKDKPLFVSPESTWGQLEVDKEYTVMGIMKSDNCTYYLVDDYGIISFCPYQLFNVTDSELSKDWHFREFKRGVDSSNSWDFIISYYELCFDDNHYINLLEQEESDTNLYLMRKQQINNRDSISL